MPWIYKSLKAHVCKKPSPKPPFSIKQPGSIWQCRKCGYWWIMYAVTKNGYGTVGRYHWRRFKN